MLIAVLLQVFLPIGLIAWLAVAPAKNVVGLVVQALATVLVLLALKLIALWMLLPWWLPLVYLGLWALAVALWFERRGKRAISRWPASVSGWAGLVVMLGFLALGAFLSWEGMAGRRPPAVGVVDIAAPFASGIYLAAHGGSRELVNGHMMTLDPDVPRFRAFRGQSYGVDLVEIDALGFRASGWQPAKLSAYAIYGESVLAPCDGVVITSRNDRPDMPVPTPDREVIAGNHVVLDCGEFDLLLAHFQPGSVTVVAGDAVSVGQVLGVVGNSGKSNEPHLHISAQRRGTPEAPLSGEPLGVRIGGRYLVRNDRVEF